MAAKRCNIVTRTLAKVAVCALLATTALTARAQFEGPCIGACRGQVIGILIGIAGGSAALGIGIFYAVHHGHTINGCALPGPNGLELQNQGDQKTYHLIGEVADIKPGDRVRVSGKKEKESSGTPQEFIVEKLAKDYGACTQALAAP